MSLETLKQQIVATVDASKDEALLQDVLDILFNNNLNEGESHYKKRLEKSIEQADAGEVLSNDNVHQMARQWLTK